MKNGWKGLAMTEQEVTQESEDWQCEKKVIYKGQGECLVMQWNMKTQRGAVARLFRGEG